jgi:undecaprenyl-diphosphatase
MSIFIALFLGIVQGLTEFLPVSSSGHLILFQHIFGLGDDMLLFDIILHVATLCAVVLVFRKTILELIRRPFCKFNWCIVLTTAVTCALVLIFKDMIDKSFTYKILPFSFLATAIILFLTTVIAPKVGGAVGFKSAFVVGVAQGIAVVPGLSRSGTTISALLISGVEKNAAAAYSFLMSIPVIIASLLLEILTIKSNGGGANLEILPTSVAFAAAFLSGILAIKFMLSVIKRVKLHWFSVYLVILAAVCALAF